METITWIKEFGRHVYLTFKLRRMVLVSIVVLSIFPGTVIFFLPSAMRWLYVLVYTSLTEVMAFCMVRFFTGSVVQVISNLFYIRKHKPEERFHLEAKQIAKKMGMEYDKPIYITDNPSIKSPFANIFSGTITLPSSWVKKFHQTEINATIGHELAHIKCQRTFTKELWLAICVTMAFTLALAVFTIQIIYQVAEFAFIMLILGYILHRNEYRADMEGPKTKATTPEALISVFEYLIAECKRDDDSETHPSLQKRINRLMPLLDSDC